MHPAELGELEAFRDLYAAAPDGVGARAEEIDGALCLRLAAAPTSAMFNRTLGLGLRGPATEEAFEEIAAFFGDEIGWCVALAPQARPRDLPSWLEHRGLVPGYGWAKFRRGMIDPPEAPTELRVERVGADEADTFAETFVRGYGWAKFSAAGCEVVLTETGEALRDKPSSSYRNIVRAGFDEEYVRPNYLSSPEADTSGIA